MALIYCRECGERISEQAASCPSCGYPQNDPLPERSHRDERQREYAISERAPRRRSRDDDPSRGRSGTSFGVWLLKVIFAAMGIIFIIFGAANGVSIYHSFQKERADIESARRTLKGMGVFGDQPLKRMEADWKAREAQFEVVISECVLAGVLGIVFLLAASALKPEKRLD